MEHAPYIFTAAVVATKSYRLVTVTHEIIDTMLAKILTITGLVATGLLLILITTTTPATAGAAGILAVFMLGYIALLCFLTFIIWLLTRLANRVGTDLRVFRRKGSISLRKSYYYASIVALGPVIIISLQSVGGVGFYDLGLVFFFVLLGCVYVARRAA